MCVRERDREVKRERERGRDGELSRLYLLFSIKLSTASCINLPHSYLRDISHGSRRMAGMQWCCYFSHHICHFVLYHRHNMGYDAYDYRHHCYYYLYQSFSRLTALGAGDGSTTFNIPNVAADYTLVVLSTSVTHL